MTKRARGESSGLEEIHGVKTAARTSDSQSTASTEPIDLLTPDPETEDEDEDEEGDEDKADLSSSKDEQSMQKVNKTFFLIYSAQVLPE